MEDRSEDDKSSAIGTEGLKKDGPLRNGRVPELPIDTSDFGSAFVNEGVTCIKEDESTKSEDTEVEKQGGEATEW